MSLPDAVVASHCQAMRVSVLCASPSLRLGNARMAVTSKILWSSARS